MGKFSSGTFVGAFIVIAAACAVGAYYLPGLNLWQAACIGLGLFAVLMTALNYHLVSRAERQYQGSMGDMYGYGKDISRRLDELSTRILRNEEKSAGLEISLEQANTQPAAALAPVQEFRTNVGNDDFGSFSITGEEQPNVVRLADIGARRQAAGRSEAETGIRILSAINNALENHQVEIHLQPIMALPDRKAVAYEVLARIPDGAEILSAQQFIEIATKSGLVPQIDCCTVRKAVSVVRRLKSRDNASLVFWNLSHATIADKKSSEDIAAYLEANQAISDQLVIEIALTDLRNIRGHAGKFLNRVREAGYRLSLDGEGSEKRLRQAVNDFSFSIVKVPAPELLAYDGYDTDRNIVEIASFLAAGGIELVATQVDEEAHVLPLLDHDVTLAQGALFSPARPLKPDLGERGNKRTAS